MPADPAWFEPVLADGGSTVLGMPLDEPFRTRPCACHGLTTRALVEAGENEVFRARERLIEGDPRHRMPLQ